MSSYPVGYAADFQEERSRLTTFFRYILAIPLLLVAIVYGVGVLVTAVIAWFALMFTARYPEGLYNFAARVVRWSGQLNAYLYLVTDEYPPFGLDEEPGYPVHITVGPAKETYSRVKVFFRSIIGIPVILINYALSILAGLCAFCAWFVIMFTGKQSESLQKSINLGMAYSVRASAYFLYLTEDWPPTSDDGGETTLQPFGTPPAAPAPPVAPEA